MWAYVTSGSVQEIYTKPKAIKIDKKSGHEKKSLPALLTFFGCRRLRIVRPPAAVSPHKPTAAACIPLLRP